MAYQKLNSDNGYIWRITHRMNLPWTLQNGIHSANSQVKAPEWVTIGNKELIDRRSRRPVPISPGGFLNDYVPFYFTPFSPMLYNIHTGFGEVAKVANEDIVLLVSRIDRISELGLPYVFTDRHAYIQTAKFYNRQDDLASVDWGLLQQRSFNRDPNDPEKVERYQAEALIHKYVPVEALLGAICYTEEVQVELAQLASRLGIELQIKCLPEWYF